jgi:hypothetical protein
MTTPRGRTAVMARRVEPPDALDFFPTPPWATRALCEIVLRREPAKWRRGTCWDPCAGEGHMAEVLREYFHQVWASDVFDYGRGYAVGSFIGEGPDRAECPGWTRPHWIVMNPPFNGALKFVLRALREATKGVAVFVRSAWIAEASARYEQLFRPFPPAIDAPFVERVPLHKGRWEPDGSTTTSYSWIVWHLPTAPGRITIKQWIPPGQRERLTRPDDRRRFTRVAPMPLFPEAAE